MRTLLLALAAAASLACSSSYAAPPDPPASAVGIFAGGCFWCIEADLEKLDGVLTVVSGYTGGTEKDPTYKQVSSSKTGHTEAVRVVYDPKKLSYDKLVAYFFRHIDPTQKDGQFCDHGPQYRTGVFYVDDAQKAAAEKAKADAEKQLGQKVVTEVTKAGVFYNAEDYHQDYYKKSPTTYGAYRSSCGRDDRVRELWSGK